MSHPTGPEQTHRSTRMPYLLAAIAGVCALVLAGCGGDAAEDSSDGSADDGGSGSYPVTVDDTFGGATIDERPEQIISLSPTATEMLFEIDAGDQVKAVDDESDYPDEAPTTDLSGYEPNIDSIVEMSPDLVVLADDAGAAAEVADELESLDVPAMILPAADDLDDVYDQIDTLGEATGHEDNAETLVDSMQDGIAEAVESAPELEDDTSIYHEVDSTLYSATSDTFIGQVYADFGLTNIADEADSDAGGYPQLSGEYIVNESPDMIFMAGGDDSADDIADRDGWDQVDAVEHANIVELDPAIASRWGPRIVDMYDEVAEATADLQ